MKKDRNWPLRVCWWQAEEAEVPLWQCAAAGPGAGHHPQPVVRLGSCQGNSYCVSLNILLPFRKKTSESMLLLELASWLSFFYYYFH